MGLRVVGAGVGRTGTESLKAALELLLGGRCYHMLEVFGRPDDVPIWLEATAGRPPNWDDFLADYSAAVDWPSSAFWRELSDAYPDAVVLLSSRDVDAWWTSATNTIFDPGLAETRDRGPFPPGWPHDLISARFTPDWQQERAAKEAFLRHNDEVRDSVSPDRLVDWQPGDGWEPICAALGLAVPAEPFPHVNSTAQFQERMRSMRDGRS